MPEDARDVLERRRADVHRLDRRAQLPSLVDEGVKGRVGEGLAEDFEAFFAASHAGEPVVDECDAETGKAARRTATDGRDFPSDAGVHAGLLWISCRTRKRRSPGPFNRWAGGYSTWPRRASRAEEGCPGPDRSRPQVTWGGSGGTWSRPARLCPETRTWPCPATPTALVLRLGLGLVLRLGFGLVQIGVCRRRRLLADRLGLFTLFYRGSPRELEARRSDRADFPGGSQPATVAIAIAEAATSQALIRNLMFEHPLAPVSARPGSRISPSEATEKKSSSESARSSSDYGDRSTSTASPSRRSPSRSDLIRWARPNSRRGPSTR